MKKSGIDSLTGYISVIIGILTIAAVLIKTGAIIERIDNLSKRISTVEEKVFGFAR